MSAEVRCVHDTYLKHMFDVRGELPQVRQRQRRCEIVVFGLERPLIPTQKVDCCPLVGECALLAGDLVSFRGHN